jgi:hypothetical protein
MHVRCCGFAAVGEEICGGLADLVGRAELDVGVGEVVGYTAEEVSFNLTIRVDWGVLMKLGVFTI